MLQSLCSIPLALALLFGGTQALAAGAGAGSGCQLPSVASVSTKSAGHGTKVKKTKGARKAKGSKKAKGARKTKRVRRAHRAKPLDPTKKVVKRTHRKKTAKPIPAPAPAPAPENEPEMPRN